MTGLEQPAVDLLTLVTAGGYRIGKGGLVKLLEISKTTTAQSGCTVRYNLDPAENICQGRNGIELLDALRSNFHGRRLARKAAKSAWEASGIR